LEIGWKLNMGIGPVPIKLLLGGFGVRGGKKLTGKPVRFKDAEKDTFIPIPGQTIGAKITGAEELKANISTNVPGDFWVTYNPAKEKETYLVDITLKTDLSSVEKQFLLCLEK